MAGEFSVLFVCTGNVCRSAAAELMLRALVPAGDPLTVASAGTGALAGHGVDAPTAVALSERGVSADGHEGQWLTEDLIRGAGLILTATSEHRDRVLRQVPATMRRAFTMREFARLGEGVEPAADPAQRPDMVRAVAARRGQVDPPAPGADEVGDPFGAGLEVARATVADVGEAVAAAARLLGLPPAR